jgi:hypothetical protein
LDDPTPLQSQVARTTPDRIGGRLLGDRLIDLHRAELPASFVRSMRRTGVPPGMPTALGTNTARNVFLSG